MMSKVQRAQLKRAKLLEAARDMFRERGVEQSSIAAIAERAQVPAGGVFYHFRTKDALVEAVAQSHLESFGTLLEGLEQRESEPRERLEVFLDVTESMREDRARLGCPVAGLVQDVLHEGRTDAGTAAEVFTMVVAWLERQFHALKLSDDEASRAAVHMFSGVQGGFLLAFAMSDPSIVSREVAALRKWLEGVVGS